MEQWIGSVHSKMAWRTHFGVYRVLEKSSSYADLGLKRNALSVLTTVVLLNTFVETVIHFCSKEQHLFEIEKFCRIINVFTDQLKSSDVTYIQVWWPILWFRALHFTHPSAHTHTEVNTHTPWSHTQSSGQPFMLRRPGSSWGFGALLEGTSSWYWGWRERSTFTISTYNSCRPETRTHNLSIMSPTLPLGHDFPKSLMPPYWIKVFISDPKPFSSNLFYK